MAVSVNRPMHRAPRTGISAMFIGHYGIAFMAKAAEPSLPLSGLMMSTQLMDVAWSAFIMTGVEKMRLTLGPCDRQCPL